MATRGKRARAEEPNVKTTDGSELKTMPTSVDQKYAINPEFFKLLVNTKAESLRPPSGVIFVCKRDDLIVDVWKGLVRHNFLSVPVLQKRGDKYYGFVDLMDICNYAVEHFGRYTLENSEDYWKLVKEDELFQKKLVRDIMVYPISRRNPFHPVNKGYSLFHAIEILARERGLHRVPVIDENRKLINIITQSQLVQFLHEHLNMIGEKKNKTIEMVPDALKSVFHVHEDQLAIEAFKMMTEHALSGVAIVDSDGKLVGNISLVDLKAISPDGRMFHRLYQTAKNFILKIRKEYAEKDGRPRSVVFVKPTDTLETAIRVLAEHKIHRVYVVDDEHKPIGIISLKDILLQVVSDY